MRYAVGLTALVVVAVAGCGDVQGPRPPNANRTIVVRVWSDARTDSIARATALRLAARGDSTLLLRLASNAALAEWQSAEATAEEVATIHDTWTEVFNDGQDASIYTGVDYTGNQSNNRVRYRFEDWFLQTTISSGSFDDADSWHPLSRSQNDAWADLTLPRHCDLLLSASGEHTAKEDNPETGEVLTFASAPSPEDQVSWPDCPEEERGGSGGGSGNGDGETWYLCFYYDYYDQYGEFMYREYVWCECIENCNET